MPDVFGRMAVDPHELIRQVVMAHGTIDGLTNRVTVTEGSLLVADRPIGVTSSLFEVRRLRGKRRPVQEEIPLTQKPGGTPSAGREPPEAT